MLRNLFVACDKDGGGTVDLVEFMEMAQRGKDGEQSEESLEVQTNVFAAADADGNGKLELEEFVQFYLGHATHLSDEKFRTQLKYWLDVRSNPVYMPMRRART